MHTYTNTNACIHIHIHIHIYVHACTHLPQVIEPIPEAKAVLRKLALYVALRRLLIKSMHAMRAQRKMAAHEHFLHRINTATLSYAGANPNPNPNPSPNPSPNPNPNPSPNPSPNPNPNPNPKAAGHTT